MLIALLVALNIYSFNIPVTTVVNVPIVQAVEKVVIVKARAVEEVIIPELPLCDNPYNCCVTYLREIRGIPIRGDADTIIPNLDIPIKGVVVIFNYNGVYHVAEVGYVLLDRFIIEAESNFGLSGKESSGRIVMMNDTSIVGYRFVNPNR